MLCDNSPSWLSYSCNSDEVVESGGMRSISVVPVLAWLLQISLLCLDMRLRSTYVCV